ncbi:MAG TPA: DISARM system helicase DrmA [Pirellulales bacterium]|nr:DISARM system helicase DrmA [Pirellulales bacterium]
MPEEKLLAEALSPTQLRAKLEEMVVKDLLGPAERADEELDERSVRDRYLVGVLAPRRQATQPTPQPAGGEDEEFPPVLLDELEEDGAEGEDDGPQEFSAPLPKATFPASFGMTFCVSGQVRAIEASAQWGQYLKLESEYLLNEKSGNPKRVWKRHPRGGRKTIPLTVGPVGPLAVDDQCPQVFVQGVVRQREGDWIVTLFLVNGQEEPRQNKDSAWLFQPELAVAATDGSAIFCKKVSRRNAARLDPLTAAENAAMEMLYRRYVEFAVGHGVSVHAETAPGVTDQAVRIRTQVIPAYEVCRTTPPTIADADRNPAFGNLAGLVLDMRELAEADPSALPGMLAPLVAAYDIWIANEAGRAGGLGHHQAAAGVALDRCRESLRRIQEGLALLDPKSESYDAQAVDAFQFMNRAMWWQRTRSIFSEIIRRGEQARFEDIDVAKNRSWYPFQIAFILLNMPGVTRLDHPDRGERPDATADLLWFPTGGGKTESYLGLAAYTMGLRRLQGVVEGRSGEDGITVLMRYTLRLLTIQQFQRATALMCACEIIRRGDSVKWGKSPFRIGLWVGRRTTPNTTKQSAEAVKLAHGQRDGASSVGGIGTPFQLTFCPWCGGKIERGKQDVIVEEFAQGAGRTFIYCGNPIGQRCPFTATSAPKEGLPVLVVDEEIYRRLPTMLIATVDKFAQMPWNGAVQMLFGQVTGQCERHGYISPEIDDVAPGGSGHPKTRSGYAAAKALPHTPLRPPDLIIQDELHLISGPLGTLVGLYETAIDKLCTWEVHGRKVRPKVIASTATIRRSMDQVHALFLRKVNVFPAHGLDIEDNFFSLQRPASDQTPGRRYLGICAPGRRLKAALIRVYVAFLSSAQALYEKHDLAADPWMTLVGYFNSMRELGGMRRLVDDDVASRLRKMDRRGLAKRYFSGADYLQELTSRMASSQIPLTLDRLEFPFDPAMQAKRKAMAKIQQFSGMPGKPLDVLLATNMISVGVDVKRLGLMVVGGQPKTTAEYIQATSRVGRSHPGIVCTVFNWARPRDLSHYETFEHYHATFYQHVEALSVTPFSPGALNRGLAALLVACVRLEGSEFNGNDRAALLATHANHQYVQEAIKLISDRAHLVGKDNKVADFVKDELKRKVDCWQAEAQRTAGGRVLGYRDVRDGVTVNLLHHPGMKRWEEFTCLNSLREVEPTVKLILDDHHLDDDGGATAAPAPEPPAEDEGSDE